MALKRHLIESCYPANENNPDSEFVTYCGRSEFELDAATLETATCKRCIARFKAAAVINLALRTEQSKQDALFKRIANDPH